MKSNWITTLLHRIQNSAEQSCLYAVGHFKVLAVLGFIMYPLYYFVWTGLFEQPYESLTLRLLCVIVCVFLYFFDHLPPRLRRHSTLLWFIAFTYLLPFFFTFMLLKNNMNIVWAMSTMGCLALMVLMIYDWIVTFIMFFTGVIFAFLIYSITGDLSLNIIDYFYQLPIYLFLLIAGSVFNYKAQTLFQEKINTATALSGIVAHELRTPLISIDSAAKASLKFLPKLLEGYELAQQANLAVPPLRSSSLSVMKEGAKIISKEVEYANIIIDMLTTTTNLKGVSRQYFENVSIDHGIIQMLDRYPFKDSFSRDMVELELGNEQHYFYGSDILLVHVLFNLMKNACNAALDDKKLRIKITLGSKNNVHVLTFRDNGPGIKERDLAKIFLPFFTASYPIKGTGLGLSFCKMVMTEFGGDIECVTKLGEFTEFILTFPAVKSSATITTQPTKTQTTTSQP